MQQMQVPGKALTDKMNALNAASEESACQMHTCKTVIFILNAKQESFSEKKTEFIRSIEYGYSIDQSLFITKKKLPISVYVGTLIHRFTDKSVVWEVMLT